MMRIARTELLEVLKIVEPALASKELLDELTHIWFFGTHILAYNDKVGIEVPFKTDFKGGLKGSILLGLLNASRAKEVELIADDKEYEVVFKAAGAKATLALLDLDKALFEMPAIKNTFDFDKDLLAGIRSVLLSVGYDTTVPDQLGVTFLPDGNDLNLFTTDSKTISWIIKDCPKGLDDRVVVPTAFCTELLRLFKDGGELSVRKNELIAKNKKGIVLYAKPVDVQRPVDLMGMVERHGTDKKGFVPIPGRLGLAVERALVILQNKPGDPIELIAKGDSLRLEVKSGYGELKDAMQLEKDHADVEAKLDPGLIKRALGVCDQMRLTEDALVLRGAGDFVYLISPYAAD